VILGKRFEEWRAGVVHFRVLAEHPAVQPPHRPEEG
jgi:hypothetical protein